MSSAATLPLPFDRETRARLLRGFKRRKRLRRCPPIRFPHAVEREYLRAILAMLERAHELVGEQLLPALPGIVELGGFRTDDDRGIAGPIGRIFDWIELQHEQQISEDQVRNTARRASSDTSRHNREQVDRQVRTVLGVEVFPSEPWLDGAMDSFVRQNVQLIKTIPKRYFEEIEEIVHREVRAGRRAAEIADQLEDRFSVARNRAALIAQDQVGKFHGQLTGQRHRDLGIRRYRWRNSRDERVRGNPGGLYPHATYSHWAREGRIYEEEKPPPDGHPGEPIRCRCWREPVFEDILGPEFRIDLTPAPPAREYR
jgi:SPP1 gp7 family putative phage head morphogenesis protein